jgi:membrane-associated phospholipid phosphatase
MSGERKKVPKLSDERLASLSLAERADIGTVRALAPVLNSRAGQALGRLGNLADEPPLLALSGLLCGLGLLTGRPRLARAGARMIAAHLLATALKEAGKDRIDRSRPEALIDKNRYQMNWGRSERAALRAFPSGHSAGSVALARAASRELPVARFAYPLAALMGALQVFRRAHFPGDVLAGVLLGLAAEETTSRIFEAAGSRAAD